MDIYITDSQYTEDISSFTFIVCRKKETKPGEKDSVELFENLENCTTNL